jgi:3-methyladenine DNA glycosylase AlkD
MTSSDWYEMVSRTYTDKGNPLHAEAQARYMKYKFAFYGLKAPEWLALTKDWFKTHGAPKSGLELDDLVQLCYEDDHREMQYFAIEALQKRLKEQPENYIEQLEYCITNKSWWDTVDWLAKLVGMHFKRYPHLIVPTTERWMASGNIWLQRVSIIFQLFYKTETNTDLMFRYILQVAHDKEFFLRKGAGWALRQHTRTDPEIIRTFVAKHEKMLSPLTKKEALRLLK